VTGRADLDARLRDAQFKATDLVEGSEKGARFEYSDGALVVSKTIRTIKGGRAFRVEADVRENGVAVPVRLFWGPGFGQPTDEEKSLQGYIPPQVVEIDENGGEIRQAPGALTSPRTSRARIVGVENKYFAAILTREDGTAFEVVTGASTHEGQASVHVLAPPPVLLAVGARFDDRVIGSPAHFASEPRKIIHIDIDPSSISKRVKVDVPIVGNVPDVLEEMLKLLEGSKPDAAQTAAWWKRIEEWRAKQCLNFKQGDDLIMPQYVVQKLYEITKGEAIVCSDVGQHQMWAAQYYPFAEPRRWLNSGGLGTMGVGLPYAMGAQFANPDATVAVVTGEGSIQMCIQELSTAKQFRLPLKIISLNNRYLGMVRQWQEMFYESRYSGSYMDSLPDFVKLAEAYGHVGIRVERPEDVEPALRKAFIDHKDELVFIDFQTNREANVFPMVAAGKGLTDMILAEDL